MSAPDRQTLRLLDGRFVLERLPGGDELADEAELLAVVRGPDGGARMRRDDSAGDTWSALWNGDAAHPPDATGMVSAVVAPLAAGAVPVWVAASFDGDLVLIPSDRVDDAVDVLHRAGHQVVR